MNLDKTWCASPTDNHTCGREITPDVEAAMEACDKTYYSVAYLCGGEPKTEDKKDES